MEVITIQLTERQEQIIRIVKQKGPIKGEEIADLLGLVRATLRPDLSILTKSGLLEARPKVGYYYSEQGSVSRISDEVKKLLVGDFKSVPAVVNVKTSVYDAIVNLFMMDSGSLFIVSEGGLLEGVVSRKDLLKVTIGKLDIQKVPITVVMTRMPNIVTVSVEESLWQAARKIVEHEVDCLPVVRPVNFQDREGLEVIGKVSKTNITKAFYELGLGKIALRGGEIL